MNTPPRETSTRGLFVSLLSLLLLAALSLGLRFANLGNFGLPIALLIAAMKAGIVAVFFMEIATEKATVHLAIAAGLAMFALMLTLIVLDVWTRSPAPLGHPPGTAARERG